MRRSSPDRPSHGGGQAFARPRGASDCGRPAHYPRFLDRRRGDMSAIQVVEGSRHAAVLDAPGGDLCVPGAPPGPIKLSLIIPTFNEARNLPELVTRLTSVLDGCLPGRYEMIVVDDDSPDQTWTLALRLADRYPALRVMRRRGEKGLSTAVIRGWQAARGEVLAVIDADLQHPPEMVERLWTEVSRGADLAIGSRHAGGGGVS